MNEKYDIIGIKTGHEEAAITVPEETDEERRLRGQAIASLTTSDDEDDDDIGAGGDMTLVDPASFVPSSEVDVVTEMSEMMPEDVLGEAISFDRDNFSQFMSVVSVCHVFNHFRA